jgi:transcriptional regulator with XRE-family HTH domain
MTDPNEGLAGPNGEPGWTVDDSEFAARLVLVRFRLRWNVKQAAQECGLSATQWAAWENGSMPRRYVETCKAIASRTGVDYLWLSLGHALSRRWRSSASPCEPTCNNPFSCGRATETTRSASLV